MRKTSPAARRRIARERQSAAKRARALAMRQAGATYAAIGAELGVCVERARGIVLKAERLTEHRRWFDALPTRATTFLRNHGFSELAEIEAALAVAKFSRRELMDQPNLGRGALEALTAWLERHGLALRAEITIETNK